MPDPLYLLILKVPGQWSLFRPSSSCWSLRECELLRHFTGSLAKLQDFNRDKLDLFNGHVSYKSEEVKHPSYFYRWIYSCGEREEQKRVYPLVSDITYFTVDRLIWPSGHEKNKTPCLTQYPSEANGSELDLTLKYKYFLRVPPECNYLRGSSSPNPRFCWWNRVLESPAPIRPHIVVLIRAQILWIKFYGPNCMDQIWCTKF